MKRKTHRKVVTGATERRRGRARGERAKKNPKTIRVVEGRSVRDAR